MLNNKKMIKLTAILAVAAAMTGCSSMFTPVGESSFSCPGMPQGVTCKTPMAVHKSTNGSLPVAESDLPIGGIQAQAAPASYSLPSNEPATKKPAQRGEVMGVSSASLGIGADMYGKPIREPATIMRVWVAPWVDKNDDVHFPSYLYTEIQPRRWSVGKPEFTGKGTVIPYKVLGQAENGSAPKMLDNKVESGSRSGGSLGVPNLSDIKLD